MSNRIDRRQKLIRMMILDGYGIDDIVVMHDLPRELVSRQVKVMRASGMLAKAFGEARHDEAL